MRDAQSYCAVLLDDNNRKPLCRLMFNKSNRLRLAVSVSYTHLDVYKRQVVEATLIAAPSSTKNNDKARDPEMHSSQKGNQWHFGMKAHIGACLLYTSRCV